MNNGFCISKDKLHLLWKDRHWEDIYELHKKFGKEYSSEEIIRQMRTKEGEVGNWVKDRIQQFSRSTENEEIGVSFQLSRLYFGDDTNTQICFEMRNDFDAKDLRKYDDLVDNINNGTYVDCLIKEKDEECKFQIKGYREEFRKHDSESVKGFLKEIIEKYGDMSDTTLVIVLQPNYGTPLKIDFEKISKYLKNLKDNSFKEIAFIVNENNKHMVLQKVFPSAITSKVDINLMVKK